MRQFFRIILTVTLSITAVTTGYDDTLTTTVEPEELPNIAVLTLKNSEGITPGGAALITDRLNVELFRTKRVTLLERDQINDILKEQGFQGSGACSDEKCLVEMGQVLGVREIITGSLGQLGSLIIINLRSIDVATGQIVKVVSQDIPGKLENVIYHLPNIARKLVGLKEVPLEKGIAKEETVPEEKQEKLKILKPTKNSGMLVVKTIPAGADIILNGKKVGTSPFTDNTLMPNEYTLETALPRFETYTETFELAAGYTKIVARNLIYEYGLLTIVSKPEGAQVTLNEQSVGTTPYQNDTVTPGENRLNLSLEGYVPIDEKIQVRKHVRDTLSYTLFSAAKVDSVKTHKKEMTRGKRNARRVIFGMIAAGAWGTGIYYNSQVKKHNDKAQKLIGEYNAMDPEIDGSIDQKIFAETYDAAVDEEKKAKDNALIRNILYGSGGLFTLFFVLSIPF